MTGNRTKPQAWLAACLAALLPWLAACDSAPAPFDSLGRPPAVSDLTFSPSVVEIDALPSSAREGESVRVPISIAVSASDPDGDLAEVSFVIQSPVRSSEPVAEGQLTAGAGNTWSSQSDVLFSSALTGPYVLLVYAADARGIIGNEVRGTIELTASGNPPVIETLEAPDRIIRPAAGQPPVPLVLIATVSDPDGAANIARVEMTVDGGSALLLCDDGGQAACNPGFASGDATADDGMYTLTLQVESTNSPGNRLLVFTAVDRSGLRSEPVQHVLTIE